uniref:30S ribosomal protein S15 n=1 Tax=Aureoumbra lagunensis TaxID=44058 RepID=A0A7S3JTL3_9STRA|mmetsp:Transcript_20741/g.26840  ORF Transcript_20741/g.26840 Transcript_20741/m.26840 type:complete len:136 (+) Transcript_20741:68-475(+)
MLRRSIVRSFSSASDRRYKLLDPKVNWKMSEAVEKVLSLSNASSKERRKASSQQVADAFRLHDLDCGSTRVQIARLTVEINALKLHLEKHPKDFSTKYGFRKKLGKREGLIKYLKRTNPTDYVYTLKTLGMAHRL